jgi:sorting nexin-4
MRPLSNVYSSFYGNLDRSVDNYNAMYDQIRVAPQNGLAQGSDSEDVTRSSAATSTAAREEPPLQVILDDPDYDQISDREVIIENEACWRGDPLAIRRRAMAEDFSEGKLETLVDSPQKELAGTPNQYISYQVTTKVGTCERSSIVSCKAHI